MGMESVSFLRLLLSFMEYAQFRGKKDFPPLHSVGTRPWHEFLYQVQEKLGKDYPVLKICLGEFNWDGPYPTSREFQRGETTHVLSMYCDLVWGTGRMTLAHHQEREKNPLLRYPDLAERMLEIALTIPGFFTEGRP